MCSSLLQGLRQTRLYIANGVCLFVSWLFARIALFLWFFKHMWDHQTEIAELRQDVQTLILTVPPLLFVLNVFWFTKILKGLLKLLRGQDAKVCCQQYIDASTCRAMCVCSWRHLSVACTWSQMPAILCYGHDQLPASVLTAMTCS